jgi:hypothetical protein
MPASQQAYERLTKLERDVGISAAKRIATGPVKTALLQAETEFDADVLIIGRTSETEPRGRLRDLTYAVVRDLPFPVLSV